MVVNHAPLKGTPQRSRAASAEHALRRVSWASQYGVKSVPVSHASRKRLAAFAMLKVVMQYMKLSQLMQELKPELQLKYVHTFKDAVAEGEIDAVPVDTSFQVRKSVQRDLITAFDDAFKDWHTETVRQLELSVKGGRAVVYESDVLAGKIDLKAKAEEYRKTLRKRRKPGKKSGKLPRMPKPPVDEVDGVAGNAVQVGQVAGSQGVGSQGAGQSELPALGQRPGGTGGRPDDTEM